MHILSISRNYFYYFLIIFQTLFIRITKKYFSSNLQMVYFFLNFITIYTLIIRFENILYLVRCKHNSKINLLKFFTSLY